MEEKGHDVYWLYDPRIFKFEFNKNVKFVNRNSLKALGLCLKAEWSVISYSASDFGYLKKIIPGSKILMLWHAIGIKNAGFTDIKLNEDNLDRFKRETGKYHYVLASSDIDRYYTAAYQHVDIRRVKITGSPKTDIYLRNRRSLKVNSENFKILYAPTFRDFETDKSIFFPFNEVDKVLEQYFDSAADITIDLRPHPNDKSSIKHAIELESRFGRNIKYFGIDIIDDIDEVLHTYDAIITDYSSIFMDTLLADIPVIFVAHDIDKYKETRGLAYDYDLVTPGPVVSCVDSLLNAVDDAKDGAQQYASKREAVKKIFFNYTDGNACERICEVLNES